MKTNVISCIIMLCLFSCIVKKMPQNNNDIIPVISQQTYKNYIFYIGINATQDTVMFIVEKQKMQSCKTQDVKRINIHDLRPIMFIKEGSDTLFFEYTSSTVIGRKSMKIRTGVGIPGSSYPKNTIYSYSSFPYLINSCKNISDK